jgi:hypothetical protein
MFFEMTKYLWEKEGERVRKGRGIRSFFFLSFILFFERCGEEKR